MMMMIYDDDDDDDITNTFVFLTHSVFIGKEDGDHQLWHAGRHGWDQVVRLRARDRTDHVWRIMPKLRGTSPYYGWWKDHLPEQGIVGGSVPIYCSLWHLSNIPYCYIFNIQTRTLTFIQHPNLLWHSFNIQILFWHSFKYSLTFLHCINFFNDIYSAFKPFFWHSFSIQTRTILSFNILTHSFNSQVLS